MLPAVAGSTTTAAAFAGVETGCGATGADLLQPASNKERRMTNDTIFISPIILN
jgi:hypothetical protein